VSSRPRIVAVDDNPRNLEILRRSLGEEVQFVPASSGEEALQVAPRVRPDLILLDIMMPGIGGYETCKRLKARPDLAGTKILMVSAKGSTLDRLEGYAAGADDYVVKPFDPAELLAKVRIYLRLKSVEEVDRLKTSLLSLLSHETRTPLTLILSPISMLLESKDLAPQHRELVTVVDSGARRLVTLLDRVEFLSQLKMGEIPFEMGPADLGAIARNAVRRLEASSERAGVRLTLETERPAPIHGDAKHLARVVDALLDNAIRFSPSGGTVRLRTETTGTDSRLTVSDSGPGIHPDLLPRLFEEFAVADVDHHSQGHGLSLATARLIAERHAGALELEPGAVPTGATFRLDLPSADGGLPRV
jgi:two-component system sensor histidine kinase/response regulator